MLVPVSVLSKLVYKMAFKISTSEKLYYEENIEAALADIGDKNTSIRNAAFKYGIPFSTLMDRKNNSNVSFKGSGSTTVLSQQTESIIIHLSSFVNGIMV